MATYSITVSNQLRLLGEGPSTKWGQVSFPATMVWGTAKWGEGRPMYFQVTKYVENSQAVSGVYHYVSMQKVHDIGSITLENETGSEELLQGSWNYVFPSVVTDGEDRYFPSFTSGSAASTSFTCGAAASTTWT